MTSLICIATIMVNLSGLPWMDLDLRSKKYAIKVCRVQYKSCLVKFIKKEFQVYHAICGGVDEKRP